jgi:hypothetical protein
MRQGRVGLSTSIEIENDEQIEVKSEGAKGCSSSLFGIPLRHVSFNGNRETPRSIIFPSVLQKERV